MISEYTRNGSMIMITQGAFGADFPQMEPGAVYIQE